MHELHTETVEVDGGSVGPWDRAAVGGREVIVAGVYVPATAKSPAAVLVRRTHAALPAELRPVAVIFVDRTEHGHYGPEFVKPEALSLG
jgi:hypothetical protein